MVDLLPGKALFARFAALLTRPEPCGEERAATTKPAAPPPKPRQHTPNDFEERLREVLGRSGSAVSGRVHLLNLQRIAEHYGPRWPALEEKVDQLIALTISRRLSPRDFFTRARDGLYVIMFDGLSEAEAKLKCSILADEITAKLVGRDTAMETLEVRSAVARVDGGVEFAKVNTLEALDALLLKAERTPATPVDDGPQWQAIADLMRAAEREIATWTALPHGQTEACDRIERLLDLLRQAESALAEQHQARARHMMTLVGAGDVAAEAPADPQERRVGALRSMLSALVGRAEAELRDRRLGLTEVTEGSFSLDSAELVFRYQPLWHVTHQLIIADADLAHIWPLQRRHVVPSGVYFVNRIMPAFTLPEPVEA